MQETNKTILSRVNIMLGMLAFIIILLLIMVAGRSKSDSNADLSAAAANATLSNPAVETNYASAITSTSAILNGTVINEGTAPFSPCFMFSNKSTMAGATTYQVSGNFYTGDAIAYPVSGLTPNTSYYFQACGKDYNGVSVKGTILTFMTAIGQPPTPGNGKPLVINEISYEDNVNYNGKFIELYNPNQSDSISIDGWNLSISDTSMSGGKFPNGSKVTTIALKPSGTVSSIIKPGEFYTICVTGKSYANYCSQYDMTDLNSSLVYKKYNLYLKDQNDKIVDTVDSFALPNGIAWPDYYQKILPGYGSLQLIDPALNNNDGANWCGMLHNSYSLGKKNAPCPQQAENVIINEVHYAVDPKIKGDRKYIEFYNNWSSDWELMLDQKGLNGVSIFELVAPLAGGGSGTKVILGPGKIKSHGYWVLCGKLPTGVTISAVKCDQTLTDDSIFAQKFVYLLNQTLSTGGMPGSWYTTYTVPIDFVNHSWPGAVNNSQDWADYINPMLGFLTLSLKDPKTDNNIPANWCPMYPSAGIANPGPCQY